MELRSSNMDRLLDQKNKQKNLLVEISCLMHVL